MNLKFTAFIFLLGVIISCQNKETAILPLAEHPRPDFQREIWQNLNGYWQFKADSANLGLDKEWQNNPQDFNLKILVPFSWASPMSEVELPDVHVGWYARTFQVENKKKWENLKPYLVFGASDFHTTVWLNNQKVGDHKGGYVPFDFNISQYLQEGENQLVVRVEDQELDSRPSGKQYYGNAKGIWQTVYLEGRPDHYITNLKFTPDIDKSQVTAEVFLNDKAAGQLDFNLEGDAISFHGTVPEGENSARFTIPLENMKLWDLDDPYLYEVTAQVGDGTWSDRVSSYFGMRKISAMQVPGQDFQYVALNNRPLYLKLALDQSYHPEGFYTFPSDQFMKEEIQRAKDLGLNGLRIHIKAEVPRKLYWADKLGLLIQEDVPNYWGEPDSIARSNWEYIAQKEIERDYNHPSIFSWVLFNETWGLFTNDSLENKRSYLPQTQEWVRSWYHNTKAYDSTRLVEDNSPCNLDHVITDINTWHSYTPARNWSGYLDMVVENTYPGSSYNYIGGNVQGNEPMFNSECGAVWGYSGSTGDIDITWEYHIMMNEFRKRPKIAGFLFTEFHDVINEWNGYYRFDRTKKMFGLDELVPGMRMNDFHTDLYVVAGEDFFQQYEGGSTVEIPVGISTVTSEIPGNLSVKYHIYGWNRLGEKFDHSSGEINATAVPFAYQELQPVQVQLPQQTAVMIFATELTDNSGNIIQRNFVPFKVNGQNQQIAGLLLSKKPDQFSDASWSIRHRATQNGNKIWGMGSGFFEYQFELPKDLQAEDVENIEFIAELASRYPQSKYLEESEAERIGMTIVSKKGTDPGYGQNSYPQTDEKKHGTLLKINANGQVIDEVELSDDPADHRGILSWMNQEPGNIWGSGEKDKKWLLDEAGSYGYLVKATLDEMAKKDALEKRKVVIQLFVDDSSESRGGLSVYGENSGQFPLNPTVVIRGKGL